MTDTLLVLILLCLIWIGWDLYKAVGELDDLNRKQLMIWETLQPQIPPGETPVTMFYRDAFVKRFGPTKPLTLGQLRIHALHNRALTIMMEAQNEERTSDGN